MKQCIFTLSHKRLKSGGQYFGYVFIALGNAIAVALTLQLGMAQQLVESSGEPSKKFAGWFKRDSALIPLIADHSSTFSAHGTLQREESISPLLLS